MADTRRATQESGRRPGSIAEDPLSNECKCRCWIGGTVSGPAKVKKNTTVTYTFNPGTIGNNGSPPCSECKHTDTTWACSNATIGLNPQGAAPHTSCKVTIPNNAASGTKFKLTATPSATCKCVKGAATNTVQCTGDPYQTDDITVE